MERFVCKKCGSIDVFIKAKNENQTGLYCKDCGQWIKWIGKNEKNLIEHQIADKKPSMKEVVAELKENDKNAPTIDYLRGKFDGYKEGYAEAVKQLKGVLE